MILFHMLWIQKVLSHVAGSSNPAFESSDALKQNVLIFLRSLQQFPIQPLPFPLDTYRDFFVLVSEWRTGESSL